MKYAVCVISLGYTRLAGITLYDSETKEFTETTPRIARNLIEDGKIKGVKWKNGNFIPDDEFNMKDILVKSGIGKYRPLVNEVIGETAKNAYVVVKAIKTDTGCFYEIVNNKCLRDIITEEKLLVMAEGGNVAGIRIKGGTVEICEGVQIEERKSLNMYGA